VKKRLFTSYLPIAAGNKLAGFFSGTVYQNLSDKTELLKMEMEKRSIDMPAISENFTQNDFYRTSAEKLEMSMPELNAYLWQTYQPYKIWYIFAVITVFSVVALFLYNKFVLKEQKSN
jgi:hypothetical protein